MVAGLAGVLARVPHVRLVGRSLAPSDFAENPSYLLNVERMRFFYSALIREAGVSLIANSAVGAESYGRWLGIEPLPVVPNAVDKTGQTRIDGERGLRERAQIPEDAPVVLGIMRLATEKQPLEFLRVVAEMVPHVAGLRAVLVGDGELRTATERRCTELGLDGRVTLLGAVPNAARFMPEANVVLLTSKFEGMPNTLLEAIQHGIPFVSTDVGGIRRSIPPQLRAALVPNGCWTEFAERAVSQLRQPTVLSESERIAWLDEHGEVGLARATLGSFRR
jgi:glycosyltransferase involved in cell wall biosynthesis